VKKTARFLTVHTASKSNAEAFLVLLSHAIQVSLEKWQRAFRFMYRKNKSFDRDGACAKTHPALVLAKSANMFCETHNRKDLPWAVLLISLLFLSGCVTTEGGSQSSFLKIGPLPSSSLFGREEVDRCPENLRLDVIVPVFDPGLPNNPDRYREEGIWPELRKAEANRFAHKLKEALEETNKFGAVRVTPDQTATGDLYVLGRIEQSSGEEVEIELEVIDISGKVWLKDTFDHEVSDAFHRNLRNKGKDPYDPVFQEGAEEIASILKRYSAKEREDLKYLADLRFGANFSDDTFMEYMTVRNGRITLVAKPSEHDPMLKRIRAIRVRDQMFVDTLQAHYTTFSENMNESYLMWQEQSLLERRAEQQANRQAVGEAVGGAVLIGLAVLSAIAGGDSDSYNEAAIRTTGAVVAGMAGTELLRRSFKTNQEAKVHRDALNELGESVDMELAPQVIRFEKETVKLTGDAKEQFAQWRIFLQKIYAQEATPDVQL